VREEKDDDDDNDDNKTAKAHRFWSKNKGPTMLIITITHYYD
jgi:hypothetical protein